MLLTRLSAGSITTGEITALNHKVLNNSVEARSLISQTLLLSSSKNTKVLSGLWDSLSVKSHHNATHWLVAMLNIKVHLVSDLWAFGGGSGLGEEEKGGGEDEQKGDDDALEV